MTTLWLLAAVVPVLGAVALSVTHRGATDRSRQVALFLVRWSPLALVPAGAIALIGPTDPVAADWLVLGTVVGLDVVSRALLLVSVLLYGAACVTVTWRNDARAPELIAYLLVSFVGNAGVYVAQDVVTFYSCFALMSLAAVGLIIHDRTAAARRAARIYLVLAVVGETAILVGLLLVAGAGARLVADAPAAVADSPMRMLTVLLIVLGFGLKTGLFSLHVWLPLAHPAAPPPASAVLSGAMVKAGLVGWLRFLPLGEVAMPTAGEALVVLSLLGAFLAVPVGLVQRDPKVVLAYSTISQMGFVGAAVGVALHSPPLAPAAITATVIYAVHHGLAKGALFLGVPVWKHHAIGARRYLVIAGLTLAGLAVVGAPFSSGAIGKYAVKEAIRGSTLLGVDLVHLLPLVATGSTVLLIRLGWLLLHTELEPLPPQHDPELPAWLVLVLTSASVPWIVTDLWVPLEAVPRLEAVTLWDATWPVLIGIVLGAVFWRWHRPRNPDAPDRLPAGDLVVPAERGVLAAATLLRSVTTTISAGRDRALHQATRTGRVLVTGTRGAEWGERRLESWMVNGVTTLLVLTVLLLSVALIGGRP
ncbi:MAG: proton-conducting transporter membrane subunit [Dermatophilaceae bacterium]